MVKLPAGQHSYWLESARVPAYKSLTSNIEVDVVIVGGGITGLTAAYLLKQSGLTVAVLEKNRLGSGATGGTTGKVTSQHGLIYAQLLKKHGQQVARLYGQAMEAAIKQMEDIIHNEKIDCAWQRQDNFIYTTDPKMIETFKNEAEVAKSLGLPASFETKLPLPFPVTAAVRFKKQAYFNSYKYAQGLAKAVHGQGSYVFENSNVTDINDGESVRVSTKQGSVTARNIIVASKVPAWPLFARFSYAALEYPHTSYIVAGNYKGNLAGMYISPDSGQYSVLPVRDGKQQLLLIGGQNHIPGLGRSRPRQQKLADYAQRYFGINRIAYRWKAMDYIAYDYLPLVGKIYPWSKHLYTATGFKKWGLTTSLVSAMILHDLIIGKPNPLAEVFKPHRFKLVTSMPGVALKWFAQPRNATRTLAVFFLAVGGAAFVPWLAPTKADGMKMLLGLFAADTTHTLIHLGSGLVALVSGLQQKLATYFLRVFGAVYGLTAIIGFVQGHSVLGLFHINLADNLLHTAIAATCLFIGFKRS